MRDVSPCDVSAVSSSDSISSSWHHQMRNRGLSSVRLSTYSINLHTLVTSRPNYANMFLYGFLAKLTNVLQHSQNDNAKHNMACLT